MANPFILYRCTVIKIVHSGVLEKCTDILITCHICIIWYESVSEGLMIVLYRILIRRVLIGIKFLNIL